MVRQKQFERSLIGSEKAIFINLKEIEKLFIPKSL